MRQQDPTAVINSRCWSIQLSRAVPELFQHRCLIGRRARLSISEILRARRGDRCGIVQGFSCEGLANGDIAVIRQSCNWG